MFKKKKLESRYKPRQFNILCESTDCFISNFIKTSRYNIFTFLPKAILIQFKRYANIYFLAAAVLQSIPSISPLNPFTAIAPFVLVITLSVLREGLEDYPRHKSDKELNANITHILTSNGDIIQTTWANIQVGQLIYVKNEEIIPADLIIIRSSNINNVCYIETASLDGERNLKTKICDEYYKTYINENNCYDKDVISQWKMYAPKPDPMLYQYEGYIEFENSKKIPLTQKQLLLRGSKMKNTKWAIGIVVYTGMDTKIMKNAEKSKYKQTNLENFTNKLILCILICQLILCIITALSNAIWIKTYYNNHWYLNGIDNFELESFKIFLGSFLLYNTMIPISLIVSLEFVKLIQAYFIEQDQDLYVLEKNRKPKVLTVSINEELGQISYIFTDKTGTLTCNQMEFKYCTIGDEVFGQYKSKTFMDNEYIIDKNKHFLLNDMETPNPENKKSLITPPYKFYDHLLTKYFNNIVDRDILLEFRSRHNHGELQYFINSQRKLIIEFWKIITICHECIIQIKDNNQIDYHSSSPDEITLVQTAKDQGFIYEGIQNNIIQVNIFGQKKEIKLLKLFEFNSDRKRMTIIIQDNHLIKMYIKGADSIIKKRLRKDIEHPNLLFIEDKLKYFSNLGLRTLLYAMKIMELNEYYEMEQKLNSLIDAENREEKMFQIADEYENDLYPIGVTAVEDKLQKNVPDVIHDLLRANIRVWMLTGDKLETAENIAYSCKLFTGNMSIMRLAEVEKDKVIAKMKTNYEVYNECKAFKRKMAFIVEGESLAIVLESPNEEQIFLEITSECAAVVCCRATPKQKAQVVRLIKQSTGKITLAIGDGANDVNMIQEAHIGVGIYGNEGMRAVQASDYALGEFQGLFRLILVHGRWCYIRVSEMIMYFFYKNMIFTLPAFYFAFLTGFSNSTIYDDWYWSCYNMIFTALPLMIKAIFDQDFNYKMPLSYINGDKNKENQKLYEELTMKLIPLLYNIGQENSIFNTKNILIYLITGAIQGALIFIYAINGLAQHNIISNDGNLSDIWYVSIIIYTTIFLVVTMKLAMTQRYWMWLSFLSISVFSVGIYILFQFIYDILPSYNKASYTINMICSTLHYYLFIVFCLGFIIMYELIILSTCKFFNGKQDKVESLRILLYNKRFKQYIHQVQELFHEECNHDISNINNIDNINNAIQIKKKFTDSILNRNLQNDKDKNDQYENSNSHLNPHKKFLKINNEGIDKRIEIHENKKIDYIISKKNSDTSYNDSARNNILKEIDYDYSVPPSSGDIRNLKLVHTSPCFTNKIMNNVPQWDSSDDMEEGQYIHFDKSFINETKNLSRDIIHQKSKNQLNIPNSLNNNRVNQI